MRQACSQTFGSCEVCHEDQPGLHRCGHVSLADWLCRGHGQNVATTAEIERVPLELTMPERYQMAPILEPIRRVTLVAPRDGFVRSLSVPVGSAVRDTQEVAELDRADSSSRLKIAQAEVKEMRALASASRKTRSVRRIWKPHRRAPSSPSSS